LTEISVALVRLRRTGGENRWEGFYLDVLEEWDDP